LGKFWRALEWRMLACFWPFGTFYGHLVYFMAFGNLVVIWYIFPRFGILCQKIWQPCSKACTDNCTGRKKNTFERPCAEETLSFLFSRNDILPHKVDTIIFLLPYQRD
jgi:hypothetical protein